MSLSEEQALKLEDFCSAEMEITPANPEDAAPEHVSANTGATNTNDGQQINPTDNQIDVNDRSAGVQARMDAVGPSLQGVQGMQPAGAGELFGATIDTVEQVTHEVGAEIQPDQNLTVAPPQPVQQQAFHL